jgi:CheY-like chemotaxis protein
MSSSEVLLLEINPQEAAFVVETLKLTRPDVYVEVVSSGIMALDFLFSTGIYKYREPLDSPAIILLDLNPPYTDGLQILRIIKAYNRLRTIPIVVLVPSAADCRALEEYHLGINQCIAKSTNVEKLGRAIRATVSWLWLSQGREVYR